jgi:hypothetical protein
LSNLIGDPSTVKSLHNALSEYFDGVTSEEVKKILFSLYRRSFRYAECISIRQDIMPSTDADIDSKAQILIMPRGIVVLYSIMIHIDYFGELVDGPSYGGFKLVLFEMLPEQAVKYVKKIHNKVIMIIAKSHNGFWKKLIIPKIEAMGTKVDHKDTFLMIFKRSLLAFKYEQPYLNRACDNNRSFIKRYIGLPPFYVPVVMRVYHTYSPCLEEGGA